MVGLLRKRTILIFMTIRSTCITQKFNRLDTLDILSNFQVMNPTKGNYLSQNEYSIWPNKISIVRIYQLISTTCQSISFGVKMGKIGCLVLFCFLELSSLACARKLFCDWVSLAIDFHGLACLANQNTEMPGGKFFIMSTEFDKNISD